MKAGRWVLIVGMVGILAASIFTGFAIRDRFKDLEAGWDKRWEARWAALVEYEQASQKDLVNLRREGERLLGALRRLEQRLVPPDERGFFDPPKAEEDSQR